LSTFCGTTISIDDLIPEKIPLFSHLLHPTNKQIELKGLENSTCQIFDVSGKLIFYTPLFSGQTKFIPLSSSGLYTIISRSTDLAVSSIQREKIILR
jgi:hypothetical protein